LAKDFEDWLLLTNQQTKDFQDCLLLTNQQSKDFQDWLLFTNQQSKDFENPNQIVIIFKDFQNHRENLYLIHRT
jgi:hypothetical protein